MSDHDDSGEELPHLDLTDDEGHAGDDWDTLLQETGANDDTDTGGELVPAGAAFDEQAAGYRDLLVLAFGTTSKVFRLGLDDDDIGELARAWGRVADHYLPDSPMQASPLADALFTTGAIAVPHVLARMAAGAEEGGDAPAPGPAPQQEQPRPQQATGKVVPIRKDDPNGWTAEQEQEW